MKHYITKYRDEENKQHVVSWLQVNLLGKCFTFSKKDLLLG